MTLGNDNDSFGAKVQSKDASAKNRPITLADLLGKQVTVPSIETIRAATDYDRVLAGLMGDQSESRTFLDDYFGKDALKKEISRLRDEFSEKANALQAAEASKAKRESEIAELLEINEQLRKKEDLRHLLDRVHASARKKLLEEEDFRSQLAAGEECDAFVMSVDIRRSTELMLKAREPAKFAEFITFLSEELFATVINNNGVFDKFTGDGILAFFPINFSGADAAYLAVKSAAECHRVFERIYKTSRRSFSSVLRGVGLGIGIDYGRVRLLKVAEGLTVVGAPVVYACRLSGAPAGRTYLNQPALDLIEDGYRRYCVIEERSIEIKHEGEIVAYDVALNHVSYSPELPDWR